MSPAGGGRVAIRTCGATTGFFVLERCQERARVACARCTRSICPQHTLHLPGDPHPTCPECYSAARGYVSDPNDPDWAVGYRRTFYWETSSSTGDDTWWMTFNEIDRDCFDDEHHDHDHDHNHGEHDHGEHGEHGHGEGQWGGDDHGDGAWDDGGWGDDGGGEYGDDLDHDGFVDS